LKPSVKNLFLLLALTTGLGLILADRVTAQTFTVLHSFAAGSGLRTFFITNSDGATPIADLILSGNTLYGTAVTGTSAGNGTVFAVNTDGTGFTNLYSFTATPAPFSTNSDGANPYASLILSSNILYGTAYDGGSSAAGTVFAVNTNGTGFTNLHSFGGPPNDGAAVQAGLILSGNTLYGTAAYGGSSGGGTVFAINTDGTGFTNLYNFGSDGAHPIGGLILSGNTLYGTTEDGGSAGDGTVFAINTSGTGFTNLYSFAGGSNGASPQAGLILSGNTLYGTTQNGGSSGNGTVFAVNTNGTGFTNLHSFTALHPSPFPPTNSDGAYPRAGLILSGNTLYGTAYNGGVSGWGTLFAVNTDGTGFTNLHSFAASFSDGGWPWAGLIVSGNTLYGTTQGGGSSGDGTVFNLSFVPRLTITPSRTNVILIWPTNVAGFDYTGFTLQSTTNLISPVVWTTNSPPPVVVNGQNTVTNPISGTQQFFRLSQ
jgi:uncharacterized repeat protein (TIGR03803 family)